MYKIKGETHGVGDPQGLLIFFVFFSILFTLMRFYHHQTLPLPYQTHKSLLKAYDSKKEPMTAMQANKGQQRPTTGQ
jgi:hypothetical protein